MGNNVTISVIVPIYGVEKYIGRFAVSLLSQSYQGIQFIFVNDGTKDASMKVLTNLIDERFSNLKDRIIIIDKENEGCPKARRTGISYATGDYIMHADPDDWYESGAFEKIADAARSTDADVLYFDFYKEYPGKTKHKKEKTYTIGQKNEYIRNMYNHRSYGCLWNKCIKRSVYEGNRIYYPQIPCAEDFCLASQLVGYSSSIAQISSPLYHYRKDNPNAVTRRNPKFRRYRAVVNFLGQYEFHKDSPSDTVPVSVLFDDVMMRAGWSAILYGFDFFRTRPYLAENICKAPLSTKCNVPLPAQCITKVFAFFYGYCNNIRRRK